MAENKVQLTKKDSMKNVEIPVILSYKMFIKLFSDQYLL